MKKVLMIAGGIIFVLIVVTIVMSVNDKIYPISMGMHDEMNLEEGLALNGNDPVAYFTEKSAVKGDAQFTHTWNNAEWHFTSDSTKNMFAANPEKYAPQFGGYCAFAVSKGFTADSDPATFHIEDNKLYIFHAEDVKQEFLSAKEENKKLAHSNWDEQ
ncbi:MAG: YHS domain-containing protein [Calditrichaeota bacterium]|nr:MAG: YHS domain-containing protein [Calditrichota bacterium]MBL1206436.1 YHS domain-containing protein [Calditrichota bacterium]NOG46263.1 YHS domain-containing protein [Calditrichota bacterium]